MEPRALTDDDLPMDEFDAPRLVDDGHERVRMGSHRETLVREALVLLLDGPYLPRLAFLLVVLGASQEARQLLALQASILAALSRSPRKPRG